jgi:hypothetical protein
MNCSTVRRTITDHLSISPGAHSACRKAVRGGGAVIFCYTGLERIGEGSSLRKTVQHIEHAETFARIRRHGEHAHLHTGFQLLVGIRHVLRQRLLAGREKQQAPLLHLSARLSSIIRPGLTGAVAEHVHRFANDARVTHTDFIQHQEAV